ncbi:MAG: class I SAM-dependent methyltransferase [Candidatus Latescibacteria bacterium]|jgi:SAM-dependent methyltransferase|nr:class I SAM-dependent methyltransferase [Candidatus Latescibacterota bacterium]
MDPIKDRVRRGYSRSWVVRKYATIGLWPSEDRLCRTYWSPGASILDIGCGAGRTTIPLATQGFEVTGIDISLPMIRKGSGFSRRSGVRAAWAVADAADLAFADCTFDGLLFSYNGIELIPGAEGKAHAIDEAWRVLKPGGCLIFTTHAIEALNRFALLRARNLARFLLARLLRWPIDEREIGEVVHDPERNLEVYYLQILSPRYYRKLLFRSGFDLIYYNTRRRAGSRPMPRWLVDLDPDFKFYVARKPTG